MTAPTANRQVHKLQREVARLEREIDTLLAKLARAREENERLKAAVRVELAQMRARLAEVEGVGALLQRAVPSAAKTPRQKAGA